MDFNYKILDSSGNVIAKFKQVADRDVAFDALVDYWGEDAGLFTRDDIQ